MDRQLNRSFIPPIIPKPSSLLCYPPELFNPSDNVFCRFDAGRELHVKKHLGRTEFLRSRHVRGNLLESAGKVAAIFLNGRIMNLDVSANDEVQGRRIAASFFGHSLDSLEHGTDAAEGNTRWKPPTGL